MRLLKYIFGLEYLPFRIGVGTGAGADYYKRRGRDPMTGALVGAGVTGFTCVSLPLAVVIYLSGN
jgi:hypothetical protein